MYKIQHFTKQERKIPSLLNNLIKKIFLFALAIFLTNFLFNIYFYKTDVQNAALINPIAKELIHTVTTFINSRQNSKPLENIALSILGKDKDNYSFVIFNTETGERYYLNEDKIYDTASLYKLWVMAVSYEQIEQGKFSQKDVLSDSISSIDKRFGLTPNPDEDDNTIVSWPVEDALTNMITISDNNSAYLLTEKVGISNISDFLLSEGFSESKVGENGVSPKTSASDVAVFLERLYDGKFANSLYTKRMIDLLKEQQVKTKLAKYLPTNVVIAHKTGELGSFSHDGGIVFTPKGNYIIVALSNTNDQLSADEKIALVSKGIYDYFSNK